MLRMGTLAWLFLSGAGLGALAHGAGAQGGVPQGNTRDPDEPVIDYSIRPVRGGAAEVSTIRVRVVVGSPSTLRGPFSLRAPIIYSRARGIADAVENLQVRDRVGVIP